MTRDTHAHAHGWQAGRHHYVFVDLGVSRTVSMLVCLFFSFLFFSFPCLVSSRLSSSSRGVVHRVHACMQVARYAGMYACIYAGMSAGMYACMYVGIYAGMCCIKCLCVDVGR